MASAPFSWHPLPCRSATKKNICPLETPHLHFRHSSVPLWGSDFMAFWCGWVQTSPCVPPTCRNHSPVTLSPMASPPPAGAAQDHACGFLLRLVFCHWCPVLRILLPPCTSYGQAKTPPGILSVSIHDSPACEQDPVCPGWRPLRLLRPQITDSRVLYSFPLPVWDLPQSR